jgi:hypothetical protein
VAAQARLTAPGPGSTPVSGGAATVGTDHSWGSHDLL